MPHRPARYPPRPVMETGSGWHLAALGYGLFTPVGTSQRSRVLFWTTPPRILYDVLTHQRQDTHLPAGRGAVFSPPRTAPRPPLCMEPQAEHVVSRVRIRDAGRLIGGPRSSGDRAPASGAGCAGSNPAEGAPAGS